MDEAPTAPTDPAPGLPLHVRPVTGADWRSHRDLRLAMLAADPGAFWADPDEARTRTEAQWRAEIDGPRHHFQARRGEEVLGGIALLPEGYTSEHPIPEDCAHVVSLWVRPEARGSGVSGLLFDALARRAIALGRPRLLLDVDDSNLAARRLYERSGFRATGRLDPRDGHDTSWMEYAIGAERLLRP